MREKVRVLIIEDKVALAADARREIQDAFEDSDDIEIEVLVETDFDEGFARFRRGDGDVVVLDVRRDSYDRSREDEMAGHTVFRQIREARFAPVVFWTALPMSVADEQMIPLVTVIGKDDIDKLPAAIRAAVESRAVSTINDIESHVASELRMHMWTELAPNWREYTEDADPATIAQVLLSRLTRILEQDREKSFTSHPSHRYVYPPASASRAPGDVLRSSDLTWWVTLTPACDFEQNKVGFVLLAKASPLGDHYKYQTWSESTPGTGKERDRWNNLRQDVLTSTRGRFHYLPAFREIPDLVIDLEDVRSIAVEDLDSLTAVASLVSPFAEALLIQHSHHRGRIGVPDLDSELIKRRIRANPAEDDF